MRVDLYADAPRLPDGTALDLSDLVVGSEPVELEIGPGRGWFLVERLQVDPTLRILGLEIRRKWATVVDRRLARLGLGTRARVFAEDARYALPRVKPASVARVFIHFPDPWWKKRHRKRLVVAPEVIAEVARVLVPGGELFIQTDVEERALDYEQVVAAEPRLEPWGATPRIDENPYEARSPRERRALEDGLPVHRLRWRRRP